MNFLRNVLAHLLNRAGTEEIEPCHFFVLQRKKPELFITPAAAHFQMSRVKVSS